MKISFFSLGLLVSVPALVSASTAPAAVKIQSEAAAHYRQGRYEESARLLRKLIDEKTDNVDLLKDYMWSLSKARKDGEAADAARKIIALSPDDVEALSILAESAESAGNRDEAIQIYSKILKIRPGNTKSKLALSRLYQKQGKLGVAGNYLSQAAEEAPGDGNIYPALARIQNERKDYLKEAETWNKAYRQNPERNDFRFRQAKAYYNGGKTGRAVEIYVQLLSTEDQKRKALDALVEHYSSTNELPLAADLIRRNVTAVEDNSDLGRLMRLAWLYQDLNQNEAALKTAERILSHNPGYTRALLLKGDYLYETKRDYKGAEAAYSTAIENDPENPKVYPRLGMAQYLTGSYEAASQTWEKAVELNRERSDYKFKQAEALYFAKKYDAASKLFEQLLKDPQRAPQALDFLVGDKVMLNDIKGAAELIEKNPLDGSRHYKLANFYLTLEQPKKSLAAIEKYLALNPDDTPAWMLKAVCLYSMGRTRAVLKLYQRLLQLNPSSTFIMARLAEAEYNAGHKDRAIAVVVRARKLDSTNPYLMLREANYRYDNGEYDAAKRMVRTWLEGNKGPCVPVFIYHALTPFQRDPLLSHAYHMTTQAFEDQVRALKESGFTAVTPREIQEWQDGKGKMPERPVMISFDDARQDSFKHADPILKKYGMKAVMFVIPGNVERNLPNYASWNELLAYKKTGRWDLQAHGDQGHTHINVDEKGTKAFFLVRRKWLEDQKRVENEQEWRARSLADHESAKNKMREKLDVTPIAFAFPEGNYGQYNLIDSPAPQKTIETARKAYRFCFHEDDHGINLRTKDPGLWTRYMPGQKQKGRDLVRFIQDETPFSVARKTLLKWALWENKPREAFTWLEELRKGDASDYCLLTEEARIHASRNNLTTAQQLVEKAAEIGTMDYDGRKEPFIVPSQNEIDPATN